MTEPGKPNDGIRLRLVRHATLVLEIGDLTVLVDPMLNPAEAADPVPDTPNQRRNPLVELPFDDEELGRLLGSIDAVLVTHTHGDHWDARAVEEISKETPIFCQPEDEDKILSSGFSDVSPVASESEWRGLRLSRTGGRHGTGEIGRAMAPVSGFVVRADTGPTLYVAGDTIWCEEVEEALNLHRPDAVVVNAGAARFLEGDPITMTAEDVARVCRAALEARVIAVHMEAINHCLLSRSELRESLREKGLLDRVEIPSDGATVEDLA